MSLVQKLGLVRDKFGKTIRWVSLAIQRRVPLISVNSAVPIDKAVGRISVSFSNNSS